VAKGLQFAKEAITWAERHADARRRWLDHVAPEAARLDTAIGLCQDEVGRLTASVERQAARSAAVTDGRRVMQSIVAGLGPRLEQYRDRLDGPGRPPVGRAVLLVHPPFRAPTLYPTQAPGPDHGPDL
jgi:hypothetical protein